MPRFTDLLPHICIYLYPTQLDANAGEPVGGTGFGVGIASAAFPERPHVVLVTNKHVIEGDKEHGQVGCPVPRINTTDGFFKTLPLKASDWVLDPIDDLAVCLMADQKDEYLFYQVAREQLVTKDDITGGLKIGIGDDVVYVGRFMPHEVEATKFNEPVVRFGNISMLPRENVLVEGGKYQMSILVEARSHGGLSGAPVFFYKSREIMARDVVDPRFDMKLLGVVWGHLTHWTSVKLHDRITDHPMHMQVEVGPGMTAIVPAWRLNNLLEEPRMKAAIAAQEHKREELARRAAKRD